jgi:hypothetical protein
MLSQTGSLNIIFLYNHPNSSTNNSCPYVTMEGVQCETLALGDESCQMLKISQLLANTAVATISVNM